jgi:cyclase
VFKKRLIGVVTVLNGWGVQSFGYRKYLPLGRPEILVENLNRWGADEILIQCIDRSKNNMGPNFSLINTIAKLGLSTPLIYGGGVQNSNDAVKVINLGADRLLLDSALWSNSTQVQNIACELGSQALIANLPFRVYNNNLMWFNYQTKKETILDANVFKRLSNHLNWTSEIMLTDWSNEGNYGAFDLHIKDFFHLFNKPLIVFGGISEKTTIVNLLSDQYVVATAIGNFLNYKEHSLQKIKEEINLNSIRRAFYADNESSSNP